MELERIVDRRKHRGSSNKCTYVNLAVYIPYWSETYGPGLGVLALMFDPDPVVDPVWCADPFKMNEVIEVGKQFKFNKNFLYFDFF